MEKYEYYTTIYDVTNFLEQPSNLTEFQKQLNHLGDQGWELISSVSAPQSHGTSQSIICIFKRKELYYI